jgi:hypothetical protein
MLTRASTITKYVQVITLVIIGGVLFFWSFFDSLLDFTKVVGIITAVMGAVVLYFDDRISQIIRGPSGVIVHGTLNECITEALGGKDYVKEMRIMATSSEVFQVLIRDCGIRIGTCRLLLRQYPDGPTSYNRRVGDVIHEWEGLKRSGRIQDLDIVRYDSVPFEYQVIVDDRSVVFGAYAYSPSEPVQADFREPNLVHNVSSEASALIARFTKAYDANHATWKAGAAPSDHAASPAAS